MLRLGRREEDFSNFFSDFCRITVQRLIEIAKRPDCNAEDVHRFLDLLIHHCPETWVSNGVVIPKEVINVVVRNANMDFIEALFGYDKKIDWDYLLTMLFNESGSFDLILRILEYLHKNHDPNVRLYLSNTITHFLHRTNFTSEETEKLCKFILSGYISIGMSDISSASAFAYMLISFAPNSDLVFEVFNSVRGFFIPYEFYSDDIFYIPRDKLDLDILMRLFEFSYSGICTVDVPKLCPLYAEANRFDIAAVYVVFCNGRRNVPSDFLNCLKELYTIISIDNDTEISRLVPYVDTLESIDKKGMFLDTLLYECVEKNNVFGMKAVFSLFGMSVLNYPSIDIEETLYWSSNKDKRSVIKYLINLGIRPKDFWISLFRKMCVHDSLSATAIVETLPLTKDELLQLRNYVEKIYLPLNTEKILLDSLDKAED